MTLRRLPILLFPSAMLFSGCSSKSSPNEGPQPVDPGALIRASLTSTVAVNLDEIPTSVREDVAKKIVAKPADYWKERARAQAKFTSVRLVFRKGYYDEPKDALPIMPEEGWTIDLVGAPARGTVGTHDVVKVDYKLTTTILSDAGSPAVSEPALGKVGGTWDEPFVLPVDPTLVLQRTGYACVTENQFPPNSVDSEEINSMYDQECDVEEKLSPKGCHQTVMPSKSCVGALDEKVGKVETKIHFERLGWDAALADKVRIGAVTSQVGADLQVIESEFHTHRVIYRYIPADSCTIVEQCVGGPGWRRLLQFSAADKNTGAKALDIGAIDYFNDKSVSSQLIAHNVFELSECHKHYHFMHYGNFTFGDDPSVNAKRGYCLQSTNRFANNETGSLTNPYADCSNQGVGATWGDEYRAGLECQWVDVTSQDTSKSTVKKPLKFASNPDGFLCEGQLEMDAEGKLSFEPTSFKTLKGQPVDKPKCNYSPGWQDNDTDSYDVTLPMDGEGYVTEACEHGEIGPLRNCAMKKAPASSYSVKCAPGASVKLNCSASKATAPQVVRACDWSASLNTGIPCAYQDALANGIVEATGTTELNVMCPAPRDSKEPGGIVSIYIGAVHPDDATADVTCQVKQD